MAKTAHWNVEGYETQRSWRLPNGDLPDSANRSGIITYCGPEKKFEKIFDGGLANIITSMGAIQTLFLKGKG